MRTLQEVKDFLKELDEYDLVTKLNIRSEDLVERFDDWIEEALEEIDKEISQDDPDDA